MLSKRIIACLDVRDGSVVKGINFEGLRRAGDPAELAERYNAEGIDDWVVVHGGATAIFRVGSLHDAARLAEAIGKAPGIADTDRRCGYRSSTMPSYCRMRCILVSAAREHVKACLEAAVAAGGRIVDESHAPAHWTLADRAGNRVCICAWPDGG